jgi:site-specific recombinase XerD
MSRQTILSKRAWKNSHEGPLGAHIDTFAAWLQEQGYAQFTIRYFVRLVADLSRWLTLHGCGLKELQPNSIEAFIRVREVNGCLRPGDAVMLKRLLGFLQTTGAIDSPPAPALAETAVDSLCADFAAYLRDERGLTNATVKNYLPSVQRFLLQRFGTGPTSLEELNTENISAFILEQAQRLTPKRVQLVVTALRSFLRFLFIDGVIVTDLSLCVPKSPSWHMRGLPRALTPEQIEQVLSHCDRTTAVGKRNYAILLLLARLGLRAGEVVALRLEDLHWSIGEIVVHGKGASCDSLPLTRELGEAIADYLQRGRPQCTSRDLFLRSKAPLRGFASSVTISSLVKRALDRAGLAPPSKGAHLFRHGLACSMLLHGATLEQIGTILRHHHPNTTALYAKVDITRLRSLAAPWPGGAS